MSKGFKTLPFLPFHLQDGQVKFGKFFAWLEDGFRGLAMRYEILLCTLLPLFT